jgi:7-cyano-7-deazaguanine synthase in queuosine biosynthesis
VSRHSLICRLGATDTATVTGVAAGSRITEVSFIDGRHRLGFGLGHALEQLGGLGLHVSETALDLAILAAMVTAADTRISRAAEALDRWSREIDVHVPVADPARWTAQADLLAGMLHFLTGDRWHVRFRSRPQTLATLVPQSTAAQATAKRDCVCLLSGGLDSFIGAIDLLEAKRLPLFVSHYWDSVTSKHETYCIGALRGHWSASPVAHIRARVGFPKGLIAGVGDEDTLRSRSFLFFALAALAASALGSGVPIYLPENGLISLNVPLDALRLGALSTRTTHPFYVARFNDLLGAIGLLARLENPYGHKTKGEMVRACANPAFLKLHAKHTMSCSSPAKGRWLGHEPMHCGHCVPCLIRRAALLAGFGSDDSTYSVPSLTANILDSAKAEGANVRSFQVALDRLLAEPTSARFAIHQSGPLTDHRQDWPAYESVYLNGMREVAALLAGVRAQPR